MSKHENKTPERSAGITANQLTTLSDLEAFKSEIVTEFRGIVQELLERTNKKWLKSYEVKKLLGISPGTLQNLRVNGTLPYSKIGGVILYDFDDIQRVVEENKSKGAVAPYLYGYKDKR